MKITYSIFTIIVLISFLGCIDSTAPIDEETSIEIVEPCNQQFQVSKDFAGAEFLEVDNKAESERFDWRNAGTISFSALNGSEVSILLPWASGASSSIPNRITQNLLNSGQWELLHDTFRISRAGIYNPELILLFYNIYSGELRLLYYRRDKTIQDRTPSVIWTLQFTNETSAQNQSEPVAYANTETFSNRLTGNIYSNTFTNTLKGAWHYADFAIAYDPDIDQYNFDDISMIIRGATSFFDTSPFDFEKSFDSHDSVDCYNKIVNTNFSTSSLIVPGTQVESDVNSLFLPNPDLNYPLGVFTLTEEPVIITSLDAENRQITKTIDKNSYDLLFNPNLLDLATIENLEESVDKDKYGKAAVRISFDVVPDNGSETVHMDKIFKAKHVVER